MQICISLLSFSRLPYVGPLLGALPGVGIFVLVLGVARAHRVFAPVLEQGLLLLLLEELRLLLSDANVRVHADLGGFQGVKKYVSRPAPFALLLIL